MSFSYKYLPDVALADIALEVWADSWPELFSGAGTGLTGVMVNLADLQPRVNKPVSLNAPTIEELLYEWLSELVYLKDTEGLLGLKFQTAVDHAAGWHLTATISGDIIEGSRQRLGQDVKAVTYHMFEVREIDQKKHAKVVLDI